MRMLVLGIDSGVKSGWGFVSGTPGLLGRPLRSGVATSAIQRREVLEHLRTCQTMLGAPVLAVREDHSSMPLTFKTRHDRKSGGKAQRSSASILGQGGNAGRWDEQLELEGIELRKVSPNDWFCTLSGLPARTKRDDRKAWSVQYATAALAAHRLAPPKDDNEADAVCIALWGAMNLAPRRTA
jgi:hypothetical protein